MQHKPHRALRESFTSRNLPIPPLPRYRQLPRIAIQRDAPRPLWSCGTFAMSTTLHLLLGGLPPHTLPTQFITREHMLTLHKALLEWLIQGRPPNLWQGGCLHRGIHPPPGTYTGPHDCIGIAAANLLPRGKTRLNPCPTHNSPMAPPALDATSMGAPIHPTPCTGNPRHTARRTDPTGPPPKPTGTRVWSAPHPLTRGPPPAKNLCLYIWGYPPIRSPRSYPPSSWGIWDSVPRTLHQLCMTPLNQKGSRTLQPLPPGKTV